MTQIKTTYIDHMGSDLSVVNAARVSFGKKSDWEFSALRDGLLERDAKLIKYLAQHKHISLAQAHQPLRTCLRKLPR